MLKYFLKRLVALIPVMLGVTFIVFAIMDFAPGDPARMMLSDEATQEEIDALRDELGLNDPMIVRYGRYIINLCKGDMGKSYSTNNNVWDELSKRFVKTLYLSGVALVFCVITSVPLGITAACKQNSFIDFLCMFISLLGLSMPNFWLGLLLILWLAVGCGLFPTEGADTLLSVVLPAITLGTGIMATVARTTRASMLEVVRQDYIRTARAKGLPERRVIYHHAFRNAMIPTVTVVGLQLAGMLGGSVLTETVFSWPGIGMFLINAVNLRDTPVVMGCIVLYTLTFSVINFLTDMLYALIDPRVKLQ